MYVVIHSFEKYLLIFSKTFRTHPKLPTLHSTEFITTLAKLEDFWSPQGLPI